MNDIYFTSDTHFTHANFLKFRDPEDKLIRPFDSVEAMDEYMIEKWNSVVKPGDRVYHLGDVTFDYEQYKEINARLNGSKRLIVGNHDDIPKLVRGGWFKKVQYWRLFKDHNFTCTHVPLRRDQMRHTIYLNVHGHTHKQMVEEPGYFNLCVENHDYTPVSIDTLIATAKHTYETYGILNEDKF